MERSAGSAAIRIKPDATKFVADLKRDLADKQAEFVMQVSADTGQARADIERFRQQQARKGVQMNVDVGGLGQLREKVERARRDASKPVETQLELDLQQAQNKLRELRISERAQKLGIHVDVEADPARAEMQLQLLRARQEARNIELGVDIDTRRVNAKMAGLSRQFESLGRSDLLRLNLGAAGISGLPAMATGLAQVAASLQQVAQAGIAIPGILAGAGASISTLVLGLSGIKDAWDAVSSAAESSGADQAASARAAASASNQLRNANVDLGNAYDDVARATRDAKQQLRDLRIEQQGGMIDESRAILEAQKAREDLMSGNYSDIRDATLRVAEADQRLIEVRSRNLQTADRVNEANAKGIAGNDAVVAANERLTRSQQQVADAQMAVAESGSKSSAAQDKAAKAMDKLGPNAQAVVRTLVKLGPAFKDFRLAVAEPLLAGKADEFENFFTSVAPIAQTGMAEIARGWNQNITALFGSISSDEGKGLLDRILGNTSDAQAKLSAAIDPLVKGLGTLTAAGTDALPRMADGLTAVLERFRNFIVEADEDGRLEKWINDGLDGLTDLGNSVLNIGKSFTAITKAVEAGGGRTFLQWLRDGTERLQTFLNSTEGQNKLKEFFAEGRRVFEQWKPVLEDLPGLFKGIYDGASLYIGGLLKVINPITSAFSELEGLVGAAAAAFFVFQGTKVLGPLAVLSSTLGKPGTGKRGLGGVGLLGKLALAVGLLEVLDSGNGSDQTPVAGPPPATLPPAAPGQVDTGQLPVGQSAPFQNVPGAALTPESVAPILGGAGLGGAAFGPPGAAIGAFLSSPDVPAETRTKVEKDFHEIVTAIPKLNDQNLQPYADIFGLSVDELRRSSRDDLYQRFLVMAAKPGSGYDMGGFVPPAPPPPPPPAPGPAVAPPTGTPSVAMSPINPFAGFEDGGPTPGPRHRGFLAELHGQEWVHDAPTVDRYGADVMNAMWRGKIDPKALRGLLPGFEDGGPTDPNDPNYLERATGGAHQGTGAAPGPVLIAPNPTGNSGGISGILGQVASGIQTPINTGMNLIGSLSQGQQGGMPGMPASNPVASFGNSLLGGIVPGLNMGAAAPGGGQSLLPGLAGLFHAGGDQGMQQQWLMQTGDWLANWGSSALLSFGSTLLDGALGFFGMQGLMQHPIIQGAGQTASHLGGVMLSQQGAGGRSTIPFNALSPGGVDAATLQALFGPAGAPAGLLGGPVSEYGLPAGSSISYGAEGFPDWVYQLAAQYGVEASTYGGHQEGSGLNRGIDWRPKGLAWDSPEGAAVMERFANALQSAPGVEQIIFENAVSGSRVGRDPGDRGLDQTIDDYYRDDWAGHRDHVHTRFATSVPTGAQGASFQAFLHQLYGGAGQAPPVADSNGLKHQVNQAYINSGLPPNEWTAYDELLQRESSWNPAAVNPSSGAFGLHQFLGHRGSIYDQLGGYSSDPIRQAAAGFQYLRDRYNGSPAQALAFHDANNWYESGGPTPAGRTKAFPAILHGDEYVISARGRARVPDEFLHALNTGLVDPSELPQFAAGGPGLPVGVPAPPPIVPRVPDAKMIVPPAPKPPPVAVQPPPQQPTAPAAAAPAAPDPVEQQPAAAPGWSPPAGIVAPPSGIDHTLPWINTAIMSTASTLGSIASTAIQAAAAAGSMGASAAGGGMGAGAAGSMVAGLFQQGGKIATKVANVASSALVGSVPGSFGGEPGSRAYGQSMLPDQSFPDGRMGGRTTYNTFHGISDVNRLMDRLELSDKVASQAEMANHFK